MDLNRLTTGFQSTAWFAHSQLVFKLLIQFGVEGTAPKSVR